MKNSSCYINHVFMIEIRIKKFVLHVYTNTVLSGAHFQFYFFPFFLFISFSLTFSNSHYNILPIFYQGPGLILSIL